MNEVSIIINGVRYDAVEVDKYTMKCAYCDDIINMYCCNLSEHEGICFMFDLKDKCFQKSDKKFENEEERT